MASGFVGAGSGVGDLRVGAQHDSPEEYGWLGAAPCGPARHEQDGAHSWHLPGDRQQGPLFHPKTQISDSFVLLFWCQII
jgi:hypothetical protein